MVKPSDLVTVENKDNGVTVMKVKTPPENKILEEQIRDIDEAMSAFGKEPLERGERRTLILDVQGINFVSSELFNAILKSKKVLDGRKDNLIIACDDQFMEVAKITRLNKVLDIRTDPVADIVAQASQRAV